MYFVYAIKSKNRNYIYVGLTNNFPRRFSQHNLGKEKTTRSCRPFELLYIEECSNRILARKREKYFKTGGEKSF